MWKQRFGLSEELVMQQFGMLMRERSSTKRRKRLVQRAIAANPEDPQYIGLLAELYDQQGEHEKALAAIPARPWSSTPGTACCASRLAEHYYSTGKMDEAYNELGEAFLDPDLDIDAKMQVLIGFFEMTESEGREARTTGPT